MAISEGLGHLQPDRPGLGILTFTGNLFVMSLLGAAVRELVNRQYPLAEVLLFRYLAASLVFLIVLAVTTGVRGLVTRRPMDHAIRSVSGVVSLGLLFFAISRIPLADATAISYAAPIFITLLSIFLLGETIGPRRWAAVMIGFIGVLLIAQPAGGEFDIGRIAAAISALTSAFVAIWLRKLSLTEKPATIGTYYNLLGCLICLVWVFQTGWFVPDSGDWILLSAFAAGCALQQWLLTISFRYAEASLLAPFEYLAMIFAAIVGYLYWGEIPVLTTWIGALFIAGSGLFIFERRKRKLPESSNSETMKLD
ncbi:MAG: DMT family transporter [Pseudomonadota bacterium]